LAHFAAYWLVPVRAKPLRDIPLPVCPPAGSEYNALWVTIHAIRRRLQWATEVESEQKLGLRLVLAVRGSEDCDENPSSREFLFNIARERIDKLQAQAGTKFEVKSGADAIIREVLDR
jgi:hypothetical protein